MRLAATYLGSMPIEPVDVEVGLLELDGHDTEEVLPGAGRPLFGFARERAPRPPRELPRWLLDLGAPTCAVGGARSARGGAG